MKSHLCVGTTVLLLAVGALFAQPLQGQHPDRGANDNSTGRSTRDSEQSSGTDEKVYEVGHGVTPPRPIYTPNPDYTNRARKKKIQGTVLVALVLTSEGNPRDVTITKKLDPDLDNKAIEAVRSWRFEPATKDGEPVAVHLKVEVEFRLY
ncbi:MAG TPA: energy transducer TonB [Terriglobales bacterium]|nr:energy transducer TonB [Terriglobales bacterium]